VARDDLLLIIDQERNVETKRLDALSDLANLFVAMDPMVSDRVLGLSYGGK
jgi:hypothetical protein